MLEQPRLVVFAEQVEDRDASLGGEARAIDALGGQIDVAPTVLGLTGRPWVNDTPGLDLTGVLVGVVSSINLRGPIDGYTSCFEMAISNAELVGYTPYPAPGVFPPFKGPSDCNADGSHGTYWDVHDITLTLYGSCVVPTEKSTWGAIKTLYR